MDERPDPPGVGLHFPLVKSDSLGLSLPNQGSPTGELHPPLDERDLLCLSFPTDHEGPAISDRLSINHFLMNYDGGRHQN